MTSTAYPIVHAARILQIVPAASVVADDDGNVYAGWTLCDLDLEWADGERRRGREILPFGTDGGVIGATSEIYYRLHLLGDQRPEYADPVDLDELRERGRLA